MVALRRCLNEAVKMKAFKFDAMSLSERWRWRIYLLTGWAGVLSLNRQTLCRLCLSELLK